ncbi:cationic amino acid transporter 3-like [Drosophila novamexicana]|uniref:cationic amino acid transporter 3-like n=1 Tax=Drosophila novamexicana TaxID=47314 RepID=UPI0011E5D1BE|nr:cationic amino acid transporter 3-like [Drosophila novamexicana]
MSKSITAQLSRRKEFDDDGPKLARILRLHDLTAFGVGSTLGLGVYVLAGQVARHIAGPAVGICFAIAALASLFAGLCYAEFASRVPRAGSAYIYSFVTMGEFVAFTIGWNLVLEYIVGTASVARGLTSYVDALVDYKISGALMSIVTFDFKYMSHYLDLMSFTMILLLTCLLAVGVRESSWLNNIFTVLNLVTISIVIVAGATKADIENWERTPSEVPDGHGTGGFLPYGVVGVMAGAAKCFYGFIGFDCIATTGEEAVNPKRDIPLAILISLLIIFLAYFFMAVVLTMMMPYYHIDPFAPLTNAFAYVEMNAIKWCVTVGSLSALCTALLGAMFPLPRILYAMAQDGLMFHYFARIHPWTKTPMIATIVAGLVAAIIAMLLNLDQLIELGTIGVMLAYTIVAMGVVMMHYKDDKTNSENVTEVSFINVLLQIFNISRTKESSPFTDCFVRIFLLIYVTLCVLFCAYLKFLHLRTIYALILLGVTGILMIFCMLVIFMQPKSTEFPVFKVPLVPFIPCLSILVNIFLMFQLMTFTWIAYTVWMIFGYVAYFGLMAVHFLVIGLTMKLAEGQFSNLKFVV